MRYKKMLFDFYKETMEPFMHPASKILDFGSGPAPVFSQLLKSEGIDTDSYDLYFAPETPYKTRRYGAIAIIEVIEHLKSPMETLKELSGLLEPEGILSIMTAFHPGDTPAFPGWWYIQDSTHISFFNETVFRRIGEYLKMDLIYTNGKNTLVLKK